MKEPKLLPKDIIEAISAIERFVEGISFEKFNAKDIARKMKLFLKQKSRREENKWSLSLFQ
jgi:uncharacterized protein with HEPN domain